jgi:hypothetical protein
MMLVSAINSRRPLSLLVFMLASLLGLFLLPPIVQNQNYHDFADQRTLFGIPNFWNVVSNIPFIGVGAVGLWQFGRSQATMLLFLGIFLTGFDSAYYHLEPSDPVLGPAADGDRLYGYLCHRSRSVWIREWEPFCFGR